MFSLSEFAQHAVAVRAGLIVVALVFVGAGVSVAHAQTPMEIDSTAIDFGTVNVGNTSAAISVTLTNTDGAASFGPINIFGGAPSLPEFSTSQTCQGATLARGGTCIVSYTFTPSAPTTFNDSSSFTLSETADPADGEDFTVTLTGEGINPITGTPLSHDFGNINVANTSPPLTTVITNTSSDPFGPINFSGGATPLLEFFGFETCQGVTLPAGGTCVVDYNFAPSAPGVFNDTSAFTISATSDPAAGESFAVNLTGVGVNPITAAPLAHDFGAVDTGTTSPALTTVITNTSSDPFGPINFSGGATPLLEFFGFETCEGVTLPAGGTCVVDYNFAPSAPGALSDTSTFTISATSDPAAGESFSVVLIGCGVSPGMMCPAAPTTTTVTCTPNPSFFGDPVDCAAIVTSPVLAPPTGSVAFTVDGNPLSTVVLAGGQATVNTSAIPLGVHSIVASYTPDTATYLAGVSAPFSQTVQAVPVPSMPVWATAILALLLLLVTTALLARRSHGSTGGPGTPS